MVISITNRDNARNSGLRKKLVEEAAKKTGLDASRLNRAVESGNVDEIASSLKHEDAEKLRSLLSDSAAVKKMLSSPEAQELMKKLSGGR